MLYEACWGIFEGNSGPIERQFRSFCVPWEIRVTANMRPESLILRRFRFCEILFLISDALENRAPGSFRRARLKIPDLNPTAKDYPRDITVIVDFFPPSLAFIPIAVPVILVPLPLPFHLSLSLSYLHFSQFLFSIFSDLSISPYFLICVCRLYTMRNHWSHQW